MNCKKCGKAGAYLRLKTKEEVCRLCGHVERVNMKKKGGQNESLHKESTPTQPAQTIHTTNKT